MNEPCITLVEACRQAAEIISQVGHIGPLYKRAVRSIGEGELRNGILDMALEAIQDESLCREVMISRENMLSFLCGVWIQYLLVEIAGVKKEKLRTLAEQIYRDNQENASFH